jgi:DNA-binding NtrC family response regulator
MIDKVAQTDARVYNGPNGTGKELVAHQLHEKVNANFPLMKSIVLRFLLN